MFQGKTLMITGGTGSFGSTIAKRFLKDIDSMQEIRIFSRDEKKQDDMRRLLNHSKIKFHIGDVRDVQSLKNAMYGVDYIFHAAALKQVPSCEFFPLEAVKTNILGTDNVLTTAIEYGVEKIVCLSTDKAAYPINAMGISKAMMEKVALAKARTICNGKTTICCTRYGNVMASRGSVIPLFVEQIKNNKPITVTNANMTRFLMNLDEAVDLVLYAFAHGQNGDLFVQKSPACTTMVLATALKQLFHADNPIVEIGARHGEKVYETLLTKEEKIKSIDLDHYFQVPSDHRDLNYARYLSNGNQDLDQAMEYTSHNTTRLDVEQTIERLLTVEYIQNCLKG